MHPYNYNEMFILALVALSIVGVVCLGLLIVLTLFILGQKREGDRKEAPPIDTTEIIKELRKSSAVAHASFGLALIAIAISIIPNTTRLDIIIAGAILAAFGLVLFFWGLCRFRLPR